jgi:hypothetical protein
LAQSRFRQIRDEGDARLLQPRNKFSRKRRFHDFTDLLPIRKSRIDVKEKDKKAKACSMFHVQGLNSLRLTRECAAWPSSSPQ